MLDAISPLRDHALATVGILGLVLFGVFVPALAAADPTRAGLIVAPDGNDQNPGTVDKPLATLAGAKAAVARRLAAGAADDITVLFRGGTYSLATPVAFGPEDSAREKQTITYAAYPGEVPVFSGGRRIGGWQKNGNVWTADVPEARDSKWIFRRLYVNDQRRTLARTPNEDEYFRVVAAGASAHTAFEAALGDIGRWPHLGEANVVGIINWESFTIPMKAFDSQGNTLTLTGAAKWELAPRTRYFIENLPEGLDAPGEWYLDRRAGVLSYIPMPGDDMSKVQAVAPVTTQFLTISGDSKSGKPVRGLVFKGFHFRHSDYVLEPAGHGDWQAAETVPAVVTFADAADCAFEQGEIACIGTYAIEVASGCNGIRIEQNEMRDLGSGGVKVRSGSRATTIHNNFIHDVGSVYFGGPGVLVQDSSDNVMTHNEICDTNWMGICVGWTWGFQPTHCHNNRIEYNHLHHLGRGVTTDIGGIYTLGISTGTVIRNNVIHHVWDDPEGYLACGIYPDEGSSGLLIESNVVYQTAWGGLHVHYGRDNTVRNNIFAFGRSAQVQMGRSKNPDEKANWLNFTTSSMTFDHNIVLYERGDLWRRDSELTADYNLYWNTAGPVKFLGGADLARWQAKGRDAHSLVADPRCVDAANGDFRLKPDSPALALGFKPIDASQAGLIGDAAWVARPKAIVRAPVVIPEYRDPNVRLSIHDDFETTAVGAPPRSGRVYGATTNAWIRVTDEAAATGKHSLKFQDAAGLRNAYDPHLVYTVDARSGTATASFDLRMEKGASFYHEWRDWSTEPYIAGPSLTIGPDGALSANGRKLLDVPLAAWVHISIECGLGEQSDGSYKLTVILPGQTPRTFDRLTSDSRFKRMTWFGFSSMATDARVFYVDNLNLTYPPPR